MENLAMLSDDRLVTIYLTGENKAFDELLKRYQARVFSYIYSIVKSKDLADDLFQETFVKAIVTLKQGRYAEYGKFSSWILRMAHNLIIDYFRQDKSEAMISADDLDRNVLNDKHLTEQTIEYTMINDQIYSDVRRIMEALPDNQREVLQMRYFNDMSFREIADATQVSINTALGRVRYAIINMRRIAERNRIALTV